MGHPLLDRTQLFRPGESIYVQKSSSLPEFIDKLHFHDFIEISYIIQGECVHAEYDKTCTGKKGDLFIMNIDTPHANYYNAQSTEPYLAYNVTFTPDFLDSNLDDTSDFLDIKAHFLHTSMQPAETETKPILKLTDTTFKEFEFLFKRMFDEYTQSRNGYYAILRGYLIELLIKIFRALDGGYKDEQVSTETKQIHYIGLAEQYILHHFHTKITLEDIAYRSLLSKSYFSQLFKEVTGLCFSDYLQKVRIDHALKQLKETNRTVSDICFACGFNDLKFFYTVFHRIIGMTPAQYRTNNKPSPSHI